MKSILRTLLIALFSTSLLAACSSPPEKKDKVVTDEKPIEIKPVGINCALPNGTAKLEFSGAKDSAAKFLKVNKIGLEQYKEISYAPGAGWPLGKYNATMGSKTVTLELQTGQDGKYTGTFTEKQETVNVQCDTYELQ